jgi:hypothetical protein
LKNRFPELLPYYNGSPDFTTDENKQDGRRTRFLHVRVTNSPKRVPFVPKQTATSSHGTITFYDNDGNQLGIPMPIKWDGTPEPLNLEISNGKIVYLLDQRLLRGTRFIDIPPDESETLAIAVRILNKTNAYGWTGESYSHDWCHPAYEIPNGEYTAKIKVFSGDSKAEEYFKFILGEEFEDFDLI